MPFLFMHRGLRGRQCARRKDLGSVLPTSQSEYWGQRLDQQLETVRRVIARFDLHVDNCMASRHGSRMTVHDILLWSFDISSSFLFFK